jgi:hypothetical protein
VFSVTGKRSDFPAAECNIGELSNVDFFKHCRLELIGYLGR